MENVNKKFPWLHELRIQNCKVNKITCEELKKMNKLRKLVLENTNFDKETIEELKQYKNENFWVHVENSQLSSSDNR